MPAVLPQLFGESCIKKRPEPIMRASDLPYPCSLVFNAGVIKYQGEYVMIFRNDYGTDRERFEKENRDFTGTSIGIARSKNGVDGWRFDPLPIIDSNDPNKDPDARIIHHVEKIDDSVMALGGGSSSSLGTGGMHTKLVAAGMCLDAGISTVILSGENPEDMYGLLEGKQIGTVFGGGLK